MRPEAALGYVAADWSVFPCHWVENGRCSCGSLTCASAGKHPLNGNGVNGASADRAQVAAWWRDWPQANIGLPAGANNLAVLDVDPKNGGLDSLGRLTAGLASIGLSLPETLTQVTGSGGCHLVYAAPEGGVKNASNSFASDLPGLDTRGRGGYIIAAPSVHASGREYQWDDVKAPIAPWPDVLTRLMEWKPKPSMKAPTGPGVVAFMSRAGYAETALRGELGRVRGAAEGARNNELNTAAFNLGQLVAAGQLDEGQVRADLVSAGLSIGLTSVECQKTVESGLRSGAQKPRRAAA